MDHLLSREKALLAFENVVKEHIKHFEINSFDFTPTCCI